jgi:glycerol-3-phosphate acyltransferase PlsX
MRIAVDAMGSDDHPAPDVEGGVLAAREFGDTIILVGDEAAIHAELARHDTVGLPIEVRHAAEKITMTDKPSTASRQKRDSSMHVGMGLVRSGEADAFVSAGNTGGVLAIAMFRQLGLGRIPGVRRPALGVVFPIPSHPILIDNGANADCQPEWLAQFALMGSLFMERVYQIERPRVALISNGEEEGKGNQLIQETIPLLEASGLNYIGNIEPKEYMGGMADVGVTDGFTGNIIIKTAEATASHLLKLVRDEIMSTTRTKVGGLLARPAFERARGALNPDEVGGAPLLGVNGVVIVAHGRSGGYAIKQAVGQARLAVANDIVAAIRDGVASGTVSDSNETDA